MIFDKQQKFNSFQQKKLRELKYLNKIGYHQCIFGGKTTNGPGP